MKTLHKNYNFLLIHQNFNSINYLYIKSYIILNYLGKNERMISRQNDGHLVPPGGALAMEVGLLNVGS